MERLYWIPPQNLVILVPHPQHQRSFLTIKIIRDTIKEYTMAVNKKVEKYKNRVGRILFELLYGSVFEEARGLSRTISLQKLSRHLQYSQPDIVGYLEYMKGADLLTDLTINYKTISQL